MKIESLPSKIYSSIFLQDGAVDLRKATIDLILREAHLDVERSHPQFSAQCHPLGFFACRWLLEERHTLRLHLWSKDFTWAQEPGWEIHDHLFSFQ